MCGILALFGEDTETPSYLLNHRGPDDYASKKIGRCRMDFYRLAINDLTPTGMQPFIRDRKMLVCNGEIYNHRQFRYYELEGTSDCEILIPVIDSFGMYDAVMTLTESAIANYGYDQTTLGPRGQHHPYLIPFGIYPAKDGGIALAAAHQKVCRALVAALLVRHTL